MIARSLVSVSAPARLETLRCQPPLTVRRIRSDDPDCCALALVGSAAGPLAGDDLRLQLDVGAGARASLTATGASLAQGRGSDEPGRLAVQVAVGPGARLTADPGALIVCQGARVEVDLDLELAADGTVFWRELVVLGRTADEPGAATLRWNVVRDDRPVLRQTVELGPAGKESLAGTAGPRVYASMLLTGPEVVGRTIVESPYAVAQCIDDHTVLITVLAEDTVAATTTLNSLTTRIVRPDVPVSAADSGTSGRTMREEGVRG